MKDSILFEVKAKRVISDLTPDELSKVLNEVSSIGDNYADVQIICDEDFDYDGYGERNGRYSVVISYGVGGISKIDTAIDSLEHCLESLKYGETEGC